MARTTNNKQPSNSSQLISVRDLHAKIIGNGVNLELDQLEGIIYKLGFNPNELVPQSLLSEISTVLQSEKQEHQQKALANNGNTQEGKTNIDKSSSRQVQSERPNQDDVIRQAFLDYNQTKEDAGLGRIQAAAQEGDARGRVTALAEQLAYLNARTDAMRQFAGHDIAMATQAVEELLATDHLSIQERSGNARISQFKGVEENFKRLSIAKSAIESSISQYLN